MKKNYFFIFIYTIFLFLSSFSVISVSTCNDYPIVTLCPEKAFTQTFTYLNITGNVSNYSDSWINSTFYPMITVDSLINGNVSKVNDSMKLYVDTYFYPLNSNPLGYLNTSTTYSDGWINNSFYNKSTIDAIVTGNATTGTGFTNGTDINVTNLYVGINTNRKLISTNDITVTVCAVGCNYTKIQEALNNVPFYLQHLYRINIGQGNYDENLLVLPMHTQRTKLDRNESTSLIINGNNTAPWRVNVSSLFITEAYGSATLSVGGVNFNQSNPYDNEYTVIGVYGSTGIYFYNITFSGGYRGITCYGGSICHITGQCNFGENILSYAINVKGGSQIWEDPGYIHPSIGTVTQTAYTSNGGSIYFASLHSNLTGSTKVQTTQRGFTLDFDTGKVWGIHNFDNVNVSEILSVVGSIELKSGNSGIRLIPNTSNWNYIQVGANLSDENSLLRLSRWTTTNYPINRIEIYANNTAFSNNVTAPYFFQNGFQVLDSRNFSGNGSDLTLNNLNVTNFYVGNTSHIGLDGLVALYHFEEDNYSVIDWGSGIYDLTNYNNSQFVSNCKFGRCYYFNGNESNQYIQRSYIPEISWKKNYTVSVWIKPNLNESTGIDVVWSNDAGVNDRNGLFINQSTTSKFLYFSTYNGSTYNSKSLVNLTSGWHHIVCINNYAGTTVNKRLFIDGIESITTGQIYLPSFNYFFRISSGLGLFGLKAFSGYIDEFSIFNRSLSQEESLALYYKIDELKNNPLLLNYGSKYGQDNYTIPNRPFTSELAKVLYVCPSGCQYSKIQDAVNTVPYILRHTYTIVVYDGYYPENVYVPPVVSSLVIANGGGAMGGLYINGNGTNTVVKSFMVDSPLGSWAVNINRFQINETEPTANELACIDVFGGRGMIGIGHNNITGNCSYGVMGYGADIYVINTTFNNQSSGMLIKRGGSGVFGDDYLDSQNHGYVKYALVQANNGFAQVATQNEVITTVPLSEGIIEPVVTDCDRYGEFSNNNIITFKNKIYCLSTKNNIGFSSSGLKFYFPFDNNSILTDYAGNSIFPTSPPLIQTVGVFGNALFINNSKFNISGTSFLPSRNYTNFTISFWYNQFTNSTNDTIIFRMGGFNNTQNKTLTISIDTNDVNDSYNQLCMQYGNGSLRNGVCSGTGDYSWQKNNWNFITFTANSNGVAKYYRNGYLWVTRSDAPNFNTIETNYMTFGNSQTNANLSIDNFMFVDRELSADEINSLYQMNAEPIIKESYPLIQNGNINISGSIFASKFFGDGTGLTGIWNLTGWFHNDSSHVISTFDSVTDKVGIGTSNPTHLLNVVGGVNVTGDFVFDGVGRVDSANKVLNLSKPVDVGNKIFINSTLAIEFNGSMICGGGC